MRLKDKTTDVLVAELLMSPAFWQAVWPEIERPRPVGQYQIRYGGEPIAYTFEGDCPDCGRHLRSRGIRFGDERFKTPVTIAIHWSGDCPAWKHRLWRLWQIHTWGKLHRRWLGWKWRRTRRRQVLP